MNTQSASPNSHPCTSSSVETVTITDLGVDVLDWCVFSVNLLF